MNELQGRNSEIYKNIRKKILNLSSGIEAFIDFPEDEIEFDKSNFKNKIIEISKEIEIILDDKSIGKKIKEGFRIAIAGEPNVGKSSFLNYIANDDIAIVSDIAGTTRDVLEVNLDLKGIAITFFDTAGLRESNDAIEREGVKRAINKIENSDLRIIILTGDTYKNKEILNYIEKDTLIILNKIDLLEEIEIEEIKFFLNKNNINNEIFPISIKNKDNIEDFINQISNRVEKIITPYRNSSLIRERYRQELNNTINYLMNIDYNNLIELIAEDIRLASNSIGKITGEINIEEVLTNIFINFCIGK